MRIYPSRSILTARHMDAPIRRPTTAAGRRLRRVCGVIGSCMSLKAVNYLFRRLPAPRRLATLCGFLVAAGCSGRALTEPGWEGVDHRQDVRVYRRDAGFAIESGALLPENGSVVVAGGGFVKVIDERGNARTLVSGRDLTPTGVVLSPDGALCACGDHSGRVWVWKTAGWTAVAQRRFPGTVTCLGFTSDSKRIVLMGDYRRDGITLLDAVTLEHVSTPVPKRAARITGSGYYAPKNLLAVRYQGARRYVRIVDVASGSSRLLSPLPYEPISHMAIAGGKMLIALRQGGGAEVADCDTGKPWAVVGLGFGAGAATGSSPGVFVMGGGMDAKGPGRLTVHSCKTGKVCAELEYPRPLLPLSFDTDRGIVIATSNGGDLLRWDLPKDLECD